VKALIQCDFHRHGELREIWYHFVVRGSLQDGEFVASDPDFSGVGGSKDSCPETGIRYLPKRDRNEGPQPTTTGLHPPGETGKPSGRGKLVIKLENGGERGCLISNGKWYNTLVGSSCATFRKHDQGEESFTLRSSRGPCGVGGAENGLSCGRGAPSTVFRLVDGYLTTVNSKGDAALWSADSVPRGTEQRQIHQNGDGDVHFEVLWRS
jgi:ribonuclease T2